MRITCPKCQSEATKILATKPPSGFPQIILVQCWVCKHLWERWKPIADKEVTL